MFAIILTILCSDIHCKFVVNVTTLTSMHVVTFTTKFTAKCSDLNSVVEHFITTFYNSLISIPYIQQNTAVNIEL